MVESSNEPSLLDRCRSIPGIAHASSLAFGAGREQLAPTLTDPSTSNESSSSSEKVANKSSNATTISSSEKTANHTAALDRSIVPPPPAPPPPENGQGTEPASIDAEEKDMKPNIIIRFYECSKEILLSSWVNVLLIFVPVGIAAYAANVNRTICFAMNAIAIVPLAGLLAFATESVAAEMGDTIGALMNVTFGNAVELIIFMYVQNADRNKSEPEAVPKTPATQLRSLTFTLSDPDHALLFRCCTYLLSLSSQQQHCSYEGTKFSRLGDLQMAKTPQDEIRIVQASLLGSILANLLLILGMCFLFGGLRFREQIYNSTVTQMSACLLSLSVMSLLLPTAFHASFTSSKAADKAVLQVSRGTSVILLLVYVLYLLFQLKSHAYMYQSTPQHVIDEESHPGLLHDVFDTSSSSEDSSSSSSTDSDGTSGSTTTAKKIKRVLKRGRRRRKSSAGSNDTPSIPSTIRTPSESTFGRALAEQDRGQHRRLSRHTLGVISGGDEADDERRRKLRPAANDDNTINSRDFENEKSVAGSSSPKISRKSKRKQRKRNKSPEMESEKSRSRPIVSASGVPDEQGAAPRTVGFQEHVQVAPDNSPRRPFNIRGLSVRDALPTMPAMPKVLSSTVFSTTNPSGPQLQPGPAAFTGVTPRALHRSSSLPGRLNQAPRQSSATPALQPAPYMAPVHSANTLDSDDSKVTKKHLSRTSAIILLLVSTALVAVCAEFLVSSIGYLVGHTSVSEAFIGLIVLPIVGNAAEHVTAVTVASKNKMDLAIGVAVGSSIQIALFVTPVIVLLGWILGKDMSLYFSLFETISLFVSAFIVNFLVLDGRSNYLEGALLIAAYVIIAVLAFFYPDSDEQSSISGTNTVQRMMMAML